jgi:hypothetical protein
VAEWLSGIDPGDVVRIEIVRVTLEGTPSYVRSAAFRLHLVDGTTLVREAAVVDKMYETLKDDVAAANRALRATPRRRGT